MEVLHTVLIGLLTTAAFISAVILGIALLVLLAYPLAWLGRREIPDGFDMSMVLVILFLFWVVGGVVKEIQADTASTPAPVEATE